MSTLPPPAPPASAPHESATPPAGSRRRARRSETGPAGPAGRRPAAPRTRAPRREAAELARAVALLWLEVESGRRRPAAVAHLLDHALWHRLRGRWVRGGAPGVLVAMLVEHHSSTMCDAVAVVRRGPRAGAITFRLRRRPDGWCVVDAGWPELDGAG